MKTLKENLLRNVGVGRIRLIEEWLDHNVVVNGEYIINKDFTIDTDGYVIIDNKEMTELPDYIQFGKVKYNFRILCPDLISLRGCPKEVGGDFICNDTKIKTLDGCPKKAKRFFCVRCRELTSLRGCPEEVETFSCAGCPKIKDLKGCPQRAKNFSCYDCGKEFTEEDVRKYCNIPTLYNASANIQTKKPAWIRR